MAVGGSASIGRGVIPGIRNVIRQRSTIDSRRSPRCDFQALAEEGTGRCDQGVVETGRQVAAVGAAPRRRVHRFNALIDSTHFTTLFGGTDSLRNLWHNLATMAK
jgi:hypothetical protein